MANRYYIVKADLIDSFPDNFGLIKKECSEILIETDMTHDEMKKIRCITTTEGVLPAIPIEFSVESVITNANGKTEVYQNGKLHGSQG